MPKFRKRPVVIEAHQWFQNGDHPEDDCYLIANPGSERFLSEGRVVRYYRKPSVDGQRPCEHCGRTMHDHGWIDTLEGGHIVCPSDWVITGIKNERYPCKPDVFAASYEPAEEGSDIPNHAHFVTGNGVTTVTEGHFHYVFKVDAEGEATGEMVVN